MEVKDRELTKVEREVLEEALRDAAFLLPNDPIIKSRNTELIKIANDIQSGEIHTIRTVYFSTAQIINILTAYNKTQSKLLNDSDFTDDATKQPVRIKLHCSKTLLDYFEKIRYSFSLSLQ